MACIVEDNDPSEIIFGCIDPLALNFNNNATVDDGSCIYGDPASLSGCTDPLAINYSELAIYEDCSCEYSKCPEGPYTITPSGAVYYIGIDKGSPVSIPLPESCCTENVVGETVSWDGQFCVTSISNCPGPFAVTVDGVVINSDGTPVTESCCGQLDFDTIWDPNFTTEKSTRPGACLQIGAPSPIECDLSFTDVIYVGDTVVFNPDDLIDTDPGDDTGDGLIDDNYGCVGIESIQIAEIGNFFIDPPQGTTLSSNVLLLETFDEGALGLQVGQQIEVSGLPNITNSCYNIPQQFVNGVTTILAIYDFRPDVGITIITDTVIQYQQPPGCLIDDIRYPVNGSCCPVFIGGGDTSEICVNFKEYQLQSLSVSGLAFGIGSDYQTLCQEAGLVGDDYFLYVKLNDPSELNLLEECSIYNFTESTFQNIKDNFTQFENIYEGIELLPNGGFSAKLLKKGLVAGDGLVLFSLRINSPYFSVFGYSVNPIQLNFNVCRSLLKNNSSNIIQGKVVDKTKSLKEPVRTPILETDFVTPSGPVNDPCDPTPETNYQDLSEECCLLLGADLGWQFIDGVCYWSPPLPPADVIIGISENDIIVDDDACTTLSICASVYLERPDNPNCYNANENVIINLLPYSGELTTNIFDVTQESSYSSERDGYCTWVRVCATINDYDGSPFKLKLNLSGTLDCCEYKVFVDDISVECSIVDTLTVTNQFECPGFDLIRTIDNKKSWVYNDGEEINRQFAPSEDADIPWRYTDYFEQSNVLEKHSKLVLNSKELALTFNMCSLDECGEPINIFDLLEYKKNFQNFWVRFMEQFIPATTIFVSGEKWCNTPSQICTVIDECGYENNLTLEELGILHVFNDPNDGDHNKSFGAPVDVIENESQIIFDGPGDFGDNSTDEPIIFGKHFYGAFLKEDPSLLINEPLTFPRGLLPSLRSGKNSYKPQIYIFE
jgi:hypothetical protein